MAKIFAKEDDVQLKRTGGHNNARLSYVGALLLAKEKLVSSLSWKWLAIVDAALLSGCSCDEATYQIFII